MQLPQFQPTIFTICQSKSLSKCAKIFPHMPDVTLVSDALIQAASKIQKVIHVR